MIRDTAKLVELRAQQAEREGQFEGLHGEGEPLDLEDLAGLDERGRFEALLTRSVGSIPEEVVLLREIEGLRARIAAASMSDGERDSARAELAKKVLRLTLLFEAAGRPLSARAAAELDR